MKIKPPILIFLVIEILVALGILSTVGELPTTIATHFNMAGLPNDFMSKPAYLAFILAFSTVMPAFVVGLILLVLRLAQSNINIPNREFWLSSGNKPATLRYLNSRIPWLGSLMCMFMGYVHWTLVTANRVQPAQLAANQMLIGVGFLLGGLLLWSVMLIAKFSRLPKA